MFVIMRKAAESLPTLANPAAQAEIITRPDFRPDRVQRILVAPAAPSAPARPLLAGSEAFAPPKAVAWHQGSHVIPGQDVACYFACNAVISGNGQIFLNDHLVVSTEFMPDYLRCLLAVDQGGSDYVQRTRGLPVRVVEGPCVALAGYGVRVYGHFLIETLFRLLVARRALRGSGLAPRYLLDQSTPSWLLRILSDDFGIMRDDIVLFDTDTERVILRQAILPTLASCNSWFHPVANSLLDELTADLRMGERLSDIRRVFISRHLSANPYSVQRRCLNEAALMRIAATEFGFTPVFIETLPWRAQIALFRGASIVVGEAGSGMHNALFSNPGTRVGVIDFSNHVQSQIGALRGHDNAYIPIVPAGDVANGNATIATCTVDEGQLRALLNVVTADQ